MKSIFTFLLCIVMSSASFAQLADGSVAPDFTATDINGKTWHLYDILETGRPVIMDISATWCGPCWSYHNSNALENFYAAHGPEGDGKAMVFFIEGDGSTNTNCLYSATGCNSTTQGNWVNGTPYPIIDNATIASSYAIGYFPTVYLICPDKTVREIGQQNATALWTQASPCALDIPANKASISKFNFGGRSLELCGSQKIGPNAALINYGTAPISSVKASLLWNGAVLETKVIAEDANVFDEFLISFDSITVTQAGQLTIEVSEINGEPVVDQTFSTATFTDAAPSFTADKVEVRIRTDVQAKDIYWAVLDDAGTIIKEGGNTAVGITGGGAYPGGAPATPGAYGNSLNIRDTFDVPANNCFTFVMVDAVGDGFKVPGNYKLLGLGNTNTFYSKVGNFGAYDGHAYAKGTSGTGELASAVTNVLLSPNPASDVLNIELELVQPTAVQWSVVNAIGQLIETNVLAKSVEGVQNFSLPLESYNNGIYFLRFQTAEGGIVTRRFVVSK